MQAHPSFRRALVGVGFALALSPGWCQDAADSRITLVRLYQGSATVERTAHVAAGSRTLTVACLPALLDPQSVQVTAAPGVRIGEITVATEARALTPRCATSTLDRRIRELEDRKDALQAETEALGLVTGYLKGLSPSEGDAGGRRLAVDAKGLASIAETLRHTGQDALQRQRQIARQQAEIATALDPLVAERRQVQGDGRATSVTVTLATAADADVAISYQVRGPSWSPGYRAYLDTPTRAVRIERQALVSQATGEDWGRVRLLLSTGQPRRQTAGPLPSPWQVGIADAVVAHEAKELRVRPSAAPAIASVAAAPPEPAPTFDVAVYDTGFATEFSVPQPIDVPANGQRVTMNLGRHDDQATLFVRASPHIDASAFLIAEIAPPPGVWPAGPMQLYRDGAYVGAGRWDSATDARVALSFGRDELVRVAVEPERDRLGSGGFIGNRAERRVRHAYAVENRHRTPITLQLLEAAPVSVDERVRVETHFEPVPAESTWNRQPGVAMWRLDLAAGATASVSADYTIGYPPEARLQDR